MSELIPIWPGAAPGSEGWTQREVEYRGPWDEQRRVRNVARPTLEVFLPERPSGTGVVVCPGGGFHFLSIDSEGTEVARWLAERGVAGFVLRYRVAETPAGEEGFRRVVENLMDHRPAMDAVRPLGTADARQALALVRARADAWRVDPARVGMMGFSAGGMIATAAAVDPDAAARPAFAAVIYGAPFDAVDVPDDAPPLFQVVAANDFLVDRCRELDDRWRWAERSSELHLYAKGGHGFGMAKRGLPIDGWIERFWDWLGAEGITSAG